MIKTAALTVFAAASLTNTFPKIDSHERYSFNGSNALAAQIRQGAPADVFASASPQEAQALFREGLCTRPVTFATNRLVLLVPRSNPGKITSACRSAAASKARCKPTSRASIRSSASRAQSLASVAT